MRKKHSKILAFFLCVFYVMGTFSSYVSATETISNDEKSSQIDDIDQLESIEEAQLESTEEAQVETEESIGQEQQSKETSSENINGLNAQMKSVSVGDSVFKLNWKGKDDPAQLLEPTSNINQSVIAQLEFKGIDGVTYAPDEIQIVLPKSIFEKRDGSIADAISMGISTSKTSDTGYYYEIVGDEVIIKNYRTVEGNYVFLCDIAYTYKPSNVADGYKKEGINAKVVLNSQEVVTSDLSIELKTNLPYLNGVSKRVAMKYEKWNTAWGEEPADADDYYFVSYSIWYTLGATGTQPYKVTLKESPQSGEVVAYRLPIADDVYLRNYTLGSTADFNEDAAGYKAFNPPNTMSEMIYTEVIVKYPRTVTARVQNDITVTLEGVDGSSNSKTATAKYTYQSVDFNYSGDSFGITKRWSPSSYLYEGAINKIERRGEAVLAEVKSRFSLHDSATARGYSLTEGGTKPFHTELINDYMYIQDDNNLYKLNPEDYEIKYIYISGYQDNLMTVDPNKGLINQPKPIEDQGKIDIYYKTTTSSDWEYLDSYDPTIHKSSTDFILPAGTYQTKLEHHDGNYSVDISPYYKVALKDTDHVKSIIKDKDLVRVHNFSALIVRDDDGNIRNSVPSSSYVGSIGEEIKAQDMDSYGHLVQRATHASRITRVKTETSLDKTTLSITSDPVNSREKVKYNIEALHHFKGDYASVEEAKLLDMLDEQREGVIYELLPKGASIDLNSIVVVDTNRNAASKEVFLTHNYKGSGRTLVEIHVKVNTTYENFKVNYGYPYPKGFYTGFKVNLEVYYPWLNIGDYGSVLRNTVAYQSLSGNMSGALPDNADSGELTESERDWFFDLDGDGNVDPDKKDVIYGHLETLLDPLLASDIGFRKSVKGPLDTDYKSHTTVRAGEEYSYRLRLQNGNGTRVKNVVFYDVLETAYDSNDYWQGEFVSIDISHPELKGIDAKVYYSTVSGLDPQAVPTEADLSNSTIWSQTKPASADITAVAIDCSTATDGSEYIYQPLESLVINVGMKAPKDVSDIAGLYAYNKALYKHEYQSLTGVNYVEAPLSLSALTTVEILDRDVTIHKTSNPASGTEADPREVLQGSDLTYNVAVQNTEEQAIRKVVVEDKIPDGLSFNADEIKGYFGNDSSTAVKLSELSRIETNIQGQNIKITIDILSRDEKFTLIIPTKVGNDQVNKVFENTAKITSFNQEDWEIESETTYHEVKSVAYEVEKVWEDVSNQDGKRPSSISVQLLLNGVAYGDEVTLNEANSWKHTFNNLPKGKDDAEAIYTVKEVSVPDGYTSVTNLTGNKFTITNTYTPEVVSYDVEKVWEDASNQDGKRPASVEIQLKADGVASGSVVTLDENNSWKHTYSNLPKYKDGTEIVYSVAEVNVPDGYTSVTNLTGNKFIITNTYTPEVVSYDVEKVWEDASNQDGKRPASIEVQLKVDGVASGDVISLDTSNNWKHTFNNLPKYKDGTEITYSIEEVDVPDDYTSVADLTGNKFTITNTYTPEVVSYDVEKVWEDASNQDGKRPASVEVQLKADGVASGSVVTLDENNSWKHTYNNLPKYKDGTEIVYSVAEVNVPDGYTSVANLAGNKFTITNTYTPEVVNYDVEKVWEDASNQDSKRPASIEVQLKADGMVSGDVVILDENNSWKHTYSNLPKYKDGTEIKYSVEEIDVPADYTSVVDLTGNKFIITNTYTPEVVSYDVEKVWEDASNQDGKRPALVEVQLKADGVASGDVITLDANNNWQHTYSNLAKYKDGIEIVYSVEEVNVPAGYTSVADLTGDKFTMTNTYTPEMVEMAVEKAWCDNDDEAQKRPESISVVLLADGEVCEEISLDANNGWSHTFENLPKYKAGTEIVYSIQESSAPEGYLVSYESNGNQVVITNTYYTLPAKAVDESSESGKDGTSVSVGDVITYVIHYTNLETDVADVVIKDQLDQGFDFVEASNGGVYNTDTHTVKWTIENVASDSSGYVTLKVKVNEQAQEIVENTATVKVGHGPELNTNTVKNPFKPAEPETESQTGDKTPPANNVITGDSNNLLIPVLMVLVSFVLIIVMITRKRYTMNK